MRILLKNGMVYNHGTFTRSDIAIEDGIITRIEPVISPESLAVLALASELPEPLEISGLGSPSPEAFEILDYESHYILPGLADVHVHLREPGFSYKETFDSGTRAAARGGFTVVCAMPNVDPPPDCPERLELQRNLIEKSAVIVVKPYACITTGGTGRGELVDQAALSGEAAAFSDDGKGVQNTELMRRAMLLAKECGTLIAAHCEDESLLNGGYIHDGTYAKAYGHRGISSESEWRQVERDLELVREIGCAYHVCHVSSAESVELIRRAKREGLDVTCETAPHYLTFTDADLLDEGRFKMNPPLRSESDCAALIEGVRDGTIEIIATDHAPHSSEEKSKGLEGSSFGVVGLETALSAVYSNLVAGGTIGMERLVELMCVNPRARFRLGGGEIVPGMAADLCVFDSSIRYTVDPERFLSLGRATPFEGRELFGKVKLTMADGRIVWREEEN